MTTGGDRTVFPEWVEDARGIKEALIDLFDDGAMPPLVIMYEGSRATAFVAPRVERDLGLRAAATLKQGVDPDALVLAFDAFTVVTGPGEDPGGARPGEYGERYRAGDPAAGQSLQVYRVSRRGDFAAYSLPYLYSGRGTRLVWLDSQARGRGADGSHQGRGADGSHQGRLADACRGLARLPSVYQSLGPAGRRAARGLTPRQRAESQRRASLRVLSMDGYVTLSVAPASP